MMNTPALPLRPLVNGGRASAGRSLADDAPRLLAAAELGSDGALTIEEVEGTTNGRSRPAASRSEEALRWLATNAHCLVWHADITAAGDEDLHWDLRIVDEEAAHRFLPLDVKPGKSYGDAWYWSSPEEDRRRSAEIVQRKVRAGEDFTQEFRCRDRDGFLHWLHEDVRVETVAPGRWRCFGICTEITDRKRADDALHESCDLYRQLLDTTTDGVWLLDADGRTVYASNRLAEMLGRTPDEMAGRPVREFTLPEDHAAHAEWHERRLTRERSHYDCRLRKSDGTVVCARVSATPMFNERGRFTGSLMTVADVTEQRGSEEAFRWLATNARCLLWYADVKDTGGEGLDWNLQMADEEAAQRFLSLDVPAGQSYADAWYWSRVDKDRTLSGAYGTGKVRDGEDYSQEFRCRDRSGTVRWLHEDVRVETLAPGRWRVFGVCTDITSRKRMEEALYDSRRRYLELLESTNEGVGLLDAEGLATYVNHRFAEMLGYTQDEMLGQPITAVLHGEDLARWPERLAQRRSGVREQYDCRFRRKDGSYVWALVCGTPIFNEQGEFTGSFGMLADITDRKEAEEALRRITTGARCILWHATVHDERGELIWETDVANVEATREVLNVAQEPGQLLSHAWQLSILPEDRERIDTTATAALRSGQPGYRHEYRFRRADGTVRWVDESAQIESAGAGRWRVTGIAIDVSERRELADQLQQAQKMEAVGRLAGGVAHDFNNMLAVINGYSELLLTSSQLPDSMRKPLQEVHHAGRRAADLTRQLLAFSRRQMITLQPVALNSVIADTELMLRRIIGEDVELVTELDPDLYLTEADRGQIHQVLMNLAVNARDAMPTGGTLTISTGTASVDRSHARHPGEPAPGEYVMLSVADTGCGMDAATISHIFEPFFTTKPEGEGTGLGLAMVYGAIKQLHGHVTVESEPGCGTTFRISLPQIHEETSVEEAAEVTGAGPRGSETILLVEDEAMVRNMACRILEGRGYRVLAADRADAAIEIFEGCEGAIDLLLTDVVMPGGMTGRTLAQIIRSQRPGVPVVFMSGYTDDVVMRHGILSGEVDFLQKPFSPHMLARKVREALAPEKGGAVTAG